MVVTDQINALRALGTDPIRKLVVPRLLAGFFMTPVLTIIADGVGIVGGWIIAVGAAAGGVEPVLDVDHRGAVHAGRLDGAHQAVLPRASSSSRSAVTSGLRAQRRHPGRRPGHDQRRGRRVGGGHCRGLLPDAAADYADVLTMLASANVHRNSPRPSGPGSPIVVFDQRVAGVRRQGHPARRQLHADHRAHQDLSGRQRRGQVDDPQADPRAAEAGRRRHLGQRRAGRPDERSAS